MWLSFDSEVSADSFLTFSTINLHHVTLSVVSTHRQQFYIFLIHVIISIIYKVINTRPFQSLIGMYIEINLGKSQFPIT